MEKGEKVTGIKKKKNLEEKSTFLYQVLKIKKPIDCTLPSVYPADGSGDACLAIVVIDTRRLWCGAYEATAFP